MGAEMRTVSVKLREVECERLDRLERAFFPLVDGRSATVRLLINVADEQLPRFDMVLTILGALGRLQRLLSPTMCVERNTFASPQLEIEFPAQQQECRPVELRPTPIQLHRFQLVNPHSRADRPLVLGMAANRPPSSLRKAFSFKRLA